MLVTLGDDALAIAGGTAVVLLLRQRLISPRYLVDLARLRGLTGITSNAATGVRIGSGTVIREHVTINRSIHPGKFTSVGENCFLMSASHVAHDCEVGDSVVLATRYSAFCAG